MKLIFFKKKTIGPNKNFQKTNFEAQCRKRKAKKM